VQRSEVSQLQKQTTQSESKARAAYRARRDKPESLRQSRHNGSPDHFHELRDEIERFDIGRFPSVEDAYAMIEDLARGLGGNVVDIGRSNFGRPIKQVNYGTGQLLSGRVNLAHPNEPYGLRALLVELEMCKHDRSLLRRARRFEIPILDVDGYEAQGWLDESLSNDPATAIRQYAFGFERPYSDLGGIEYECPDVRWPVPAWQRSPENAALMRFLRSQALDVYSTRHGYGLERGPLWLVNPLPTPTEGFRALSTAAGMPMVLMEPEEFWQERYGNEPAMVKCAGNSQMERYFAQRDTKRRETKAGTHVVDPFLARNRQGALSSCDHPLFVVRNTPFMPRGWTKRKVTEAALAHHEKLYAPLENYLRHERTPSVHFWGAADQRGAPYRDRRIMRSAASQFALSYAFIVHYRDELATRNDLDVEASDSYTFDRLYAKTFYAVLRTALAVRAFEIAEPVETKRVRSVTRDNIDAEINRYCKDLEIFVSTPPEQILASLGTTMLVEDFTTRRLSESGLPRHIHRRHRLGEFAGLKTSVPILDLTLPSM
jgi:hypothetical protein